MDFELETAAHPEQLKRVAIDPLSRVEGHGKVTLLLDQDDRVQQVRLHIVEFRGFEKFIQGRPYWEVPVMVQRLCGICPVSHHLAAAKAMDMIVGARLTPTAEKIRRLMHYGQILQSHALHFFHLASPDLLFGFDSEVGRRNVVAVAAEQPELAKKGVLLRKYGQEVIRVTAGKRVHGTGAIPGGVNKSLTADERAYLQEDIYRVIADAETTAMSGGVDIRGTQPAPGNIKGGLSSIEEKLSMQQKQKNEKIVQAKEGTAKKSEKAQDKKLKQKIGKKQNE